MRRPTPEERAVLAASIRRHRGVKVPILVDEDHGVIDGLTRLEIAEELGLAEIPFDYCSPDLDLQAKAALALELNDARRHLDPAERKDVAENRQARIERAVSLRREGMSTREIASRTGVSQSQVVADLRAATEQGRSVEPPAGVVLGLDGRRRAARVPQQREGLLEPDVDADASDGSAGLGRTVSEHPPEDEDEVQAVPGVATAGTPVHADAALAPEPRALEGRLRSELPAWDRARLTLLELKGQLQQLAAGPTGGDLRDEANVRSSKFDCAPLCDLAAMVNGCRPRAIGCPLCPGDDRHCAACKGRGWLPKRVYLQLPDAEKEKVTLLEKPTG
jgi:ParB-like chromosome segregation protein Spo0J